MGDSPPESSPETGPSRARARLPTVELAQSIAGYLREDNAVMVGACAKAGVPHRSVFRWLAQDADDGSELEQFQHIVTTALDAARSHDLGQMKRDFEDEAIGKAGAYVNMAMWRHQNRFKRLYTAEDEPTRLELTGKNGAPLPAAGGPGRGLSDVVRRQVVNEILGVPKAMTEAGERMGELNMADEQKDDVDE